jgi:hypothetical protein
MTDTTNLALPLIEGAQAQEHVTHNEALRILDTLVQLAVLDRDLNAPPASPSEGQRWIVKASPTPTGAWASHGNQIAAWQDSGWQFNSPNVGWLAYVVDEGVLLAWNGSAGPMRFPCSPRYRTLHSSASARLPTAPIRSARSSTMRSMSQRLWPKGETETYVTN